ncbi:hypothetical protein KFK09_024874 [Dendrobium nobile]|uniref:Transmembrane protein n=1 Tax=Dendrobium nobile TaxID=94219 RepID=A0A8T3AF90_DENNO|nr:hypothetical protein KFK09_024874 [Dendrobium nobile]
MSSSMFRYFCAISAVISGTVLLLFLCNSAVSSMQTSCALCSGRPIGWVAWFAVISVWLCWQEIGWLCLGGRLDGCVFAGLTGLLWVDRVGLFMVGYLTVLLLPCWVLLFWLLGSCDTLVAGFAVLLLGASQEAQGCWKNTNALPHMATYTTARFHRGIGNLQPSTEAASMDTVTAHQVTALSPPKST